MKLTLAITFFFTLTVYAVAQEKEEDSVRKNFNSYRSFLDDNNGKEAIKFLDTRTVNYYGDIIEYVKSADSLKVESLSLLDKIMVLTTRQRVPVDDILKFDGKSFLIYAIDKGMIAKNSMGFTIENVTIEKQSATGQLIVNGIDSQKYVDFHKENGDWKYDLTSSFSVGIPYLEKMADELGGERLLIETILNANKGNEQTQNVWIPINEKNGL